MGKDKDFDNVALSNHVFEPTLNPFKNGLLVNYKKVGTRFFSALISLPETEGYQHNRIQTDFRITNEIMGSDWKNPVHEKVHKMNFRFTDHYIYSDFDINILAGDSKDVEGYPHFSNAAEFLKYCEVESFNELFFENKKDIIFIVRNPIERFFSGLIQIIYHFIGEIPLDEKLRQEVKFYTKIDDLSLKKMIKVLSDLEIGEEELRQVKIEDVNKLIEFLLNHKWDLLFQDIHTQNYLRNYMEWIYQIKDKSKVKIIDLKYCQTSKAIDFFNELRGDDCIRENWYHLISTQGSNKFIYNNFLKNILLSDDLSFLSNEAYVHYIKDEFLTYKTLLNSPFYVDLKD